jgi:hypothetical protein
MGSFSGSSKRWTFLKAVVGDRFFEGEAALSGVAMNSGRIVCAVGLGMALAVGCGGSDGPELAIVNGTVTLDGAPLKEAFVTFVPESGRPSYGGTNESGYYELAYTEARKGAVPGAHTVRVSTQRAGDPDSGVKAQPERVPKKFNTQSQLKKTVEAGSNTIDFELTSK